MKCKLADIADVTMGQSPKSEYYNTNGEGYPFLQGNRTFGFKRPIFDTYTTVMTKPAKAGDVIMSVRAPVGDLNITPVDMCLGRGVCSLRMKNGNQEYLYYLMEYIKPQLISRQGGSIFGSVNRNDINDLDIDIPARAEIQQKTARYLTMLDDKIELNNKINNNLEQQASTLIAEYLNNTDSEVKFSDIMRFENGFAFSSKSYLTSGKYRIITIKNVQDGQIDSSNAVCLDILPLKMKEGCKLQVGDVLLSLTGNVGRVGIVCENHLLLNQRVAKFIPYDKALLPFLYFVFRQQNMKTKLELISRGTAQANLSPIETLDLCIHFEKDSATMLSNNLKSLFQQIIHNNQENMNLIEIRDALLPQLISGELDVSNIEI